MVGGRGLERTAGSLFFKLALSTSDDLRFPLSVGGLSLLEDID